MKKAVISLRRILSRMVFIPGIIILIFFLFFSFLGFQYLFSAVSAQQSLLVQVLKNKAESFFSEIENVLEVFSGLLPTLSEETQRKVLHSMFTKYSRFTSLYLLNSQGIVFMEETHSISLLGLDQSGEPYFKIVSMAPQVYFSEPISSLSSRTTAITCATSYFSKGELAGVLVGELNLQTIQDEVEEAYISEYGFSFIVDEFGTLIAHPDLDWVQQRPNLSNLEILQDPGNESRLFYGKVTTDPNKTGWYLGSVATIPYGWKIVVAEPLFLIAQPIILIFSTCFLMFALMTFFYILYQRRNIQFIMAPLSGIIEWSKEITSGNYQSKVDFDRSFKEIDHLIREFRLMVLAVRERDTFLESRVQVRTRELERARIQEEEARRLAESANKAKSVFLANMSHELRTPLNAVLGFSQYLIRSPRLNEEEKDNISTIISSGEHLLGLINEILDLSKIEAGRISAILDQFPLEKTLRDIESILRPKAEKKKLIFSINKNDIKPNVDIITDQQKFRQICINLLDNAIKNTNEGFVSMDVQLQMKSGSQLYDTLFLKVSDSGIGIPVSDQERIFGAFEQVERTNTPEGTGLGLALTKNFINLLNGSISVESEIGEGTVFSVELPVVINESQERHNPDKNIISGIIGDKVYKILVVEDKDASRDVLRILLKTVGFEVYAVSNGEEAIAFLEKQIPDLMLLDRRMPGIDGIEVLKRVRAENRFDKMKIIAITASVLKEEESEIFSMGANGFIRKPYQEEILFGEIEKCLNLRFVYQKKRGNTTESFQERFKVIINDFSKNVISRLMKALTIGDVLTLKDLFSIYKDRDPEFFQEVMEKIKNYKFQELLDILSTIEKEI